jgi:hypothetical protein
MVAFDARTAFNVFLGRGCSTLLASMLRTLSAGLILSTASKRPRLFLGDHKFPNREGAQQDDPAAMLIFSPVIQPLLIKVCNSCDLKLNVVYADDGKVGGCFLEVHKARDILSD